MKNQLLQIDKKKRKITSNLKDLRNKYVASIYDGLIKQKSISEIHKEIRRITTIANNQGLVYTRNMQNLALNLANKSKKQVDGLIGAMNLQKSNLTAFKGISVDMGLTPDLIIANWLFNKFDKEKVYQKTNTVAYDVAKKYEADFKDETIKLEVKRNRNYIIPKVFYLASSHNDCAIDHANYQGKIYIDEKFLEINK